MARARGATRYQKWESDLLGGAWTKNKVSVNLSFSSGYTEPWRAVGADTLSVDGNPSPIVELRLLTQGFAFTNLETC
jgi:hypothetical protein